MLLQSPCPIRQPPPVICWHELSMAGARPLPLARGWARPFCDGKSCEHMTMNEMHRRTKRSRCRAGQDPEGEEGRPDLVERAVQMLFGKKALQAAEPFGMKRMSDQAYAEQSVATTTELALPVDGDSQTIAAFRPLLAKTRLERPPLR